MRDSEAESRPVYCNRSRMVALDKNFRYITGMEKSNLIFGGLFLIPSFLVIIQMGFQLPVKLNAVKVVIIW